MGHLKNNVRKMRRTLGKRKICLKIYFECVNIDDPPFEKNLSF